MKQTLKSLARTTTMLVAISLLWSMAGGWLPAGPNQPGSEGRASAATLSVQSLSMAAVNAPGLASKGANDGSTEAPEVSVPIGITYQGRLMDNSVPANGQYDLLFTLYDALSGGNSVSNPITLTNQTVSSGLFTVSLDFGSAPFYGDARWLQIGVKAAGGNTYTTLSPRQPLTAAPFSLSSRWEGTSDKPFPYNPLPRANAISTVDAAGSVGRYASITVGTDGLGLISYKDNANLHLKVAHCSDPACTSATTTTADSTNSVGGFTSITIGADGLGLISYFDDGNGHLKVAHCSNVSCSSSTNATIDSSADVGWRSSITIGTDGLGLISYYDNANGHLKVAHCSNTMCTSATTATIDVSDWTGSYNSIAIGSDGLGLIGYLDATGVLKVAHCSNTACTSATITTIDSSPMVGWYPSLTIGSDGLGLISYYDSQNADLKVAHCSNVTCNAATLTTIDSAGDVGRTTSITRGVDGLALIAYMDATSAGALKAAHCSNAACTSANTTTLDTLGDVDDSICITTGADGLGLVGYWQGTTGTLKVAHCAGPACISYQGNGR